jgi:hypothetical protein
MMASSPLLAIAYRYFGGNLRFLAQGNQETDDRKHEKQD